MSMFPAFYARLEIRSPRGKSKTNVPIRIEDKAENKTHYLGTLTPMTPRRFMAESRSD